MRRLQPVRWLLLTALAVIGAGLGVVLTLGAGGVCVDGVSESFCGLNFLVWNLTSGAAVVLAATLGAVTGSLLGFLAHVAFPRRGA